MKFLSVYLVFLCLWTSSPRRVYSYSLSRGDCPLDYLRCENGENVSGDSPPECFQGNRLCNNVTDCTDGSDEKYCEHNYNWGSDGYVLRFNQGICPVNFVMCLKRNDEVSCIRLNAVCDGLYDCNDNSDEFFCPYDPVNGFRFKFEQGNCKNNSYSCGVLSDDDNNNDECIDSNMICNGKIDCNNHFDETFCPHFEMNNQDFSLINSTILNITDPSTYGTYEMKTIEHIMTAMTIRISNSTADSAFQNRHTPFLLKSSTSLISSSGNITMQKPSITLDQFSFNDSSDVTDIISTDATITVDCNNNQETNLNSNSTVDSNNHQETNVNSNSTVDSNNHQETNNSTILSTFLSSATGSYLVIISVIMVFVNTTIIIILIVVLVLLYRRTISIKKNQMYVKKEKNHVNYLMNNISKWDDDT